MSQPPLMMRGEEEDEEGAEELLGVMVLVREGVMVMPEVIWSMRT